MAFSPSEMRFQVKTEASRARVEGRFTSAQKELAAANKRIATTTLEYVVRYQRSQFKRPNVSTGRLQAVTANYEKNTFASAFLVGVGKPSYLDQSQAKYWRTIEDGSAVTWKKRSFLTLDLLGVFGATYSGGRVGPRYTLPGKSTGGKFLPIPSGQFGNVSLRPFHPRHEIEPMGAYDYAYTQARFPEQGVQAARRYLDQVMGGFFG
jgi:hypothetical protein